MTEKRATGWRPISGNLLRLLLITAIIGGTLPAFAHDMWANAFAEAGPDGETSVVTTIGWGHSPRPLSEFIDGTRLAGYGVIDPEGSEMPLPYDVAANRDIDLLPEVEAVPGLTLLEGGDPFMRRLVFGVGTEQGTWRVHTGVPARVSTTWIDGAGESFTEARFADEITGAARIVSSTATTRGATAYWVQGAWSEPVPSALVLELLPVSDLSTVGTGDTVTFRLHRGGRPVTELEGATFAAFGGVIGEEVEGAIGTDGIASITLPGPGLWIARSTHFEEAEAAGSDYAAFAGRVDEIRFITTVAFEVAP